jgi:hypothetical protein
MISLYRLVKLAEDLDQNPSALYRELKIMGSTRYCTILNISWVMRIKVLNCLQNVVISTAKWRPHFKNKLLMPRLLTQCG